MSRALHELLAGVVGSTPERAAAKQIAPVHGSYEELLELAERSGRVHCTNFNIRFYPLVQEARERVRAGELGEVWNVHGGYLQDWLALPTDWNWRLEPERAGELRAVSDIGSHWLDLAQFVSALRVVEVFADLVTAIPVRRRPTGEVETRGSCVVSQVSFGRKNSPPRFEVDGSLGALAWDGEWNEELWLGRRDRGNEVLQRNAGLTHPAAAAHTRLPVAHAEGFADTFRELYRAVYADVARGGPSDDPDYSTFRDGHVENLLGDAVALSNRERRWVEVPPR